MPEQHLTTVDFSRIIQNESIEIPCIAIANASLNIALDLSLLWGKKRYE